jgi:ribonucleotide reductase, class II
MLKSEFPIQAPSANPVFYRTYSRHKSDGTQESWSDVCLRTINHLREIGHLDDKDTNELLELQENLYFTSSARFLWIGGTDWLRSPKGSNMACFNCVGLTIEEWSDLGRNFDFLLNGSGVGAVLELENINKLPPITNRITLSVVGEFGNRLRTEHTVSEYIEDDHLYITIGDSREGWVEAYNQLISSATRVGCTFPILRVTIDINHVRAKGQPIKGFGGHSNPDGLPHMFNRTVEILNECKDLGITSLRLSLLLNEAAMCVVVGSVRRSARIDLGSSDDPIFLTAKDNLWVQCEDDSWSIDPKRDCLRMANHTRVFHYLPSTDTIREAITRQYYSGEGALMYAPEAIARCNNDLLPTRALKDEFIDAYTQSKLLGKDVLVRRYSDTYGTDIDSIELEHRMGRYGMNPCAEVLGKNFVCSLSQVHLEMIDPHDLELQARAFRAAAISNICLLTLKFKDMKMQASREMDPIVQVTFTGLFDFFIKRFGEEWLEWWMAGRGEDWHDGHGALFLKAEQEYLTRWSKVVKDTIKEYSNKLGIKEPNRCRGLQPAGSKSLLTGGASGWSPSKAQYYIRRITFRRDNPVALACIDYGYKIVPGQGDKDEDGKLLTDYLDPRVTEWLVEIPTKAPWVDSVEGIWDVENAPVTSQWSLYMQCQRYYSDFNVSATIEFNEDEVDVLTDLTYQAIRNNEGYVSTALLPKFNAPFPRLPFEKISREVYEREQERVLYDRVNDDFLYLLSMRNNKEDTYGPDGCESDFCAIKK